MEERDQLDANRLRAKIEYEGSQRLVAFMLADAMSCYAGNTPKVGVKRLVILKETGYIWKTE